MSPTESIFDPRGSTAEYDIVTAPEDVDILTFTAHHTFDGVPQLRRINLPVDSIKNGITPPLVYCKRLTRVFPRPVEATYKEESVSRDGRQHLYRVTLIERDATKKDGGRNVAGEGWLRIVRDERQKRRG